MSWNLEQASTLLKETESKGGGKYINPSKIENEKKFRCFGEGIDGIEAWIPGEKEGSYKPVRWETRPAELPENIRKNPGEDGTKLFIATFVWDYEDERFKVLSMTQRSLINAMMSNIADEDIGSPTEYDIKIKREKTGNEPKDVKYTLKTLSAKAVTKEIQEQWDAIKDTVNLKEMFDGGDPFGEEEE